MCVWVCMCVWMATLAEQMSDLHPLSGKCTLSKGELTFISYPLLKLVSLK